MTLVSFSAVGAEEKCFTKDVLRLELLTGEKPSCWIKKEQEEAERREDKFWEKFYQILENESENSRPRMVSLRFMKELEENYRSICNDIEGILSGSFLTEKQRKDLISLRSFFCEDPAE